MQRTTEGVDEDTVRYQVGINQAKIMGVEGA
jgi:hypothetical protein